MTKINMVRREGGSRVVSMSKIIPPEWIAVEMQVTKSNEYYIIVRIEKVK